MTPRKQRTITSKRWKYSRGFQATIRVRNPIVRVLYEGSNEAIQLKPRQPLENRLSVREDTVADGEVREGDFDDEGY